MTDDVYFPPFEQDVTISLLTNSSILVLLRIRLLRSVPFYTLINKRHLRVQSSGSRMLTPPYDNKDAEYYGITDQISAALLYLAQGCYPRIYKPPFNSLHHIHPQTSSSTYFSLNHKRSSNSNTKRTTQAKMKFFLALTSAILGAVLAAPGEEMQKRQIEEVTLFFRGAADGGYSITVPTNGASIPIGA